MIFWVTEERKRNNTKNEWRTKENILFYIYFKIRAYIEACIYTSK